jgi:hypothetical protein
MISDLIRYISFGVLAAVFALYSQDNEFLVNSHHVPTKVLTIICVALAVGALFFDYAQYLCGYLVSGIAANSTAKKYSEEWLLYKMRRFFFWSKQILGVVAGVLLVVIFAVSLF